MKSQFALLTFITAAGVFSSAIAEEKPSTPVTTNPAVAGDGVQIGVSKRDGVTFSGGEAFVTRNGATEKLTKDLLLPSGVIARPDGTVMLANKTEVTLRPSQLLTFDGKVVPIEPDPKVNPGDPRNNGTQVANPGNTTSPNGTASRPTIATNGPGRAPAGQRSGTNGSVFIGNDNVPFTGTLNPNGTVTLADGTVLNPDGSFRAVTFGPDGTPTLGTVNSNGTVTRSDGAIVFPDGSVRSANGTLLSNSTNPNSGNQPNGNQPNGNQANGNQPNGTQTNGTNPGYAPQYGPTNSRTPNSPKNAGTVIGEI